MAAAKFALSPEILERAKESVPRSAVAGDRYPEAAMRAVNK